MVINCNFLLLTKYQWQKSEWVIVTLTFKIQNSEVRTVNLDFIIVYIVL